MQKLDPRHLLVNVVKILRRLKIPYIITGGMAVLIWGRPRFTADIDIVVELKVQDIDKIEQGLKSLGDKNYISKVDIQRALVNKSEFNFIDGETGVKIDFWILKDDNPFDQSRLKRRVAKNIMGERVYFSSPEDLILIKLLWHKISPSSRQVDDVASILKISGDKINMRYLKEWAKNMNTSKILNDLLKNKKL